MVALHGVPDDSRLSDRLLRCWPPPVVAVDWRGYGARTASSRYLRWRAAPGRAPRCVRLAGAGPGGLVAHDASGPDAIDFALAEPGRVGQIVVLDAYYGHAPALRLPEMIRLFADPLLRRWPTR